MKGVIGFIFGAAIGSAVTYFVTKSKIEKQCQEDIEEIRKSVIINVADEPVVKDFIEDVSKVEDMLPDEIKSDKKAKLKTDYHKVDKDWPEEPEFESKNTEVRTYMGRREFYKTKEITEDEYNDLLNDETWDCMWVERIRNENKLVDEDGNEVGTEDLGIEVVSDFDRNCDSGDIIYVANYDLEIAYELSMR